MYQFITYRLGSGTVGGWYWQVVKDFGPIELVIAKSGQSYKTEDLAIMAYKEWVAWACSISGNPPPA